MTQTVKIPYEKLVEWRTTLITVATLAHNDREGALLLDVHHQMNEYKPEPCACTIKPLSEIISKSEQKETALTAAKEQLDKAIDEFTDAETHEETHACDIDDTIEPVTVNSKNSRAWTDDEISVIRTAATVEKAIFHYRSHFGDKRNANGIEQKWQKLRKDGLLVLKGNKVKFTYEGSLYTGKIGIVKSITDDRLQAKVEFDGGISILCLIRLLGASE